jgi:2-dehydro-3-deoxygluconokinase
MTKRKFAISALGEAMIEFNQTDPGTPQYLQGFGGDTSNAIIAAARAGARTAYLTRLGDDTFGQLLRDLWAKEQVNTEAVDSISEYPTAIYFVTHSAKGHMFTYRRTGSAACHMNMAWLESQAMRIIEQSEWLHLSGISLAISAQACETAFAAMRMARDVGTKVSFDSNLRLKLWSLEQARDALIEAISLCDLFLPSLEDMTLLTDLTEPDAIIDWSHAQGAKQVVLKLGSQGALLSDPQTGLYTRIPGRRVAAIDATGAGDCFCGNLLARLARGDTLVQATQYANTAASLTVQGWGAVACLPTATVVNKELSVAESRTLQMHDLNNH